MSGAFMLLIMPCLEAQCWYTQGKSKGQVLDLVDWRPDHYYISYVEVDVCVIDQSACMHVLWLQTLKLCDVPAGSVLPATMLPTLLRSLKSSWSSHT